MSLRVLSKSLKILNANSQIIQNFSIPRVPCSCILKNFFSQKPSDNIIWDIDPQTGEKKKKKTQIIPKITLLSSSNSVLDILTMEEAYKLAKRRDLRLVPAGFDKKADRPMYKLLSEEEYLAEDIKHKEKVKKATHGSYIKGEKVLNLGQNIAEHDIDIQVKKISKWLDKNCEVRVVINGSIDNMNKAESVYSTIESKIKPLGRIIQKRQKGSDIKFQILPPKDNKNSTQNTDNTDNNKL